MKNFKCTGIYWGEGRTLSYMYTHNFKMTSTFVGKLYNFIIKVGFFHVDLSTACLIYVSEFILPYNVPEYKKIFRNVNLFWMNFLNIMYVLESLPIHIIYPCK